MNDDQVVLVTGASGTLGLALAKRLIEKPVRALILSDIEVSGAEQFVSSYRDNGVPMRVVAADVSSRDDWTSLVEDTVAQFGGIDILINNAGTLANSGRIHNLEVEDWERCVRVNLMGTVNGIWAVVPHMRRNAGGRIINTASVAGQTAWAYAAPYGATKAAVINLTKVAAVEYARDRIRVNCVCPGTFESNIHVGLPEGAMQRMADRHPLGLGRVEDVVGAYMYLCGEDCEWTTGSAIVVDGGYTAP